jgi:predicted PhzF superfamily epimerase YddE/YHI9
MSNVAKPHLLEHRESSRPETDPMSTPSARRARRFHQLDVFTAVPLRGNPLASGAAVRALMPDMAALALAELELGVVGAQAAGADTAFEVRAFVPSMGIGEDPVTGSLHAGLAQWLIGAGLAPAAHVAAQGSALGRAGRVHVRHDGEHGWIGGDVAGCIEGTVTL